MLDRFLDGIIFGAGLTFGVAVILFIVGTINKTVGRHSRPPRPPAPPIPPKDRPPHRY